MQAGLNDADAKAGACVVIRHIMEDLDGPLLTMVNLVDDHCSDFPFSEVTACGW